MVKTSGPEHALAEAEDREEFGRFWPILHFELHTGIPDQLKRLLNTLVSLQEHTFNQYIVHSQSQIQLAIPCERARDSLHLLQFEHTFSSAPWTTRPKNVCAYPSNPTSSCHPVRSKVL